MRNDRQQRFSFRKYSVGLVSVVVGCLFYSPTVLAQESGVNPQLEPPAIVEQSSELVQQEDSKSEQPELAPSETDTRSQELPRSETQSETTKTDGEGDKTQVADSVVNENGQENKASEENPDKEISPNQNKVDSETPKKEVPLDPKKVDSETTKKEVPQEPKKVDSEATKNDANVESDITNKVDEEARVQAVVRLAGEKKETPVGATQIEARMHENQPIKATVLKELDEKGIQYKKLADFDLIFNGFVLETSYKEALKIRQVARVEKVDITPLSTANTPQDLPKKQNTLLPTKVSDENELINLQPLWDKGIKGQGRIVAVLDTGLDYEHNFFSLTDKSKAKYQNKEQMEAAMKKAGITYGKWYNDKVVYAYNYSDMNDEIKEDDPRSHGTHVAGSAVGNATKPAPTGELLKGVAPEAQLMFMRVFSDKKGMTEQGFIVAKAVEDAVKLGADTINMSFGGISGSEADTNPLTRQAFEFARKSGVVINAAAGNYAVNGYWQAKPKADAPDTGTIDEPAIENGVLAIGAFNNKIDHVTKIRLEIPALKDKKEFQNGLVDLPVYRLIFPVEGPQSYVHVEKGGEEAYRAASVKGKIALVESGGDVTDEDKVNSLRQAGAKGVLVYQNEEQGDQLQNLPMGYWGSFYPVSVLGHSLGKELAAHAGDYKLTFHQEVKKVPYSEADKMLYFTGWGLSTEGKLKPDVTLPGGMIYSAIPNGSYDMDGGTSMATPHAAGATALIKQALEERFPQYSPEQIHTLLRQLVMSTAKPHKDKGSNTYSSVRQQGSGLMDAAGAAFGNLYVTGKGTDSSLTLGNVKDSFTFEVTVHNLSNQAQELSYHTVVNTDQVENGRITLQMRQLLDQKGDKTVLVPPMGSVTIPIKINTSAYTKELSQQMKNGYFLEGFVFFKDAKTQKDLVSLPYIGFKGHYQDLPGIEKPVYEFTGKEKPFYYYQDEKAENPVKDPGNHFTALVSSIRRDGKKEQVVLGETDGKYDGNALVFSPNGDGHFDTVKLNAVVLRNVDNIHLAVYKADDTKREHPIFEQGNESEKKTDYGWRINDRSRILYASRWTGKDQNNQVVPDGEYQYVLTYRPSTPGAKPQEIVLKVKVDNQVPQLASTKDLYDPKTRIFRPGTIIEEGSGLAGKYLSYEKDGQTIEISPNQDGSYLIPEGVDPATVRFYIWDKAYNTNTLTLDGQNAYKSAEKESGKSRGKRSSEDGQAEATDGRLEVRVVDEEGNPTSQYPEMMRYQVFDSKGNRIDKEFNTYYESELPRLPFGSYTVKVVAQDENYSWVSPTTVTVELTKEHPEGLVNFVYRYKSKNRFNVVFDKDLPSGTRVFATRKDNGEQHELEQTLYEPKTFEKILLNGDYQIHIELPKGYRAVENDVFYSVGEKINRFLTTFVEVAEDNLVNPNPTPNPIPNPVPDPKPDPLIPDKTSDPGKGKEVDKEDQLIVKKADLRPMYVKPSEKKEEDIREVSDLDSKENLPKTGQAGDNISLLGIFLSLCTFGLIRKRGKESQD